MSRVHVAFRSSVPCPVCGYLRPTMRFSTVVVLAARLRETGMSLAIVPGDCTECGHHEPACIQSIPDRWKLDEEDRAKVNAVHARKFPHRQRVAS